MFYVFNSIQFTEVKKSKFGLDNKLNHVLNGILIFIEGQPDIYLSLHFKERANVLYVN